MNQNIPVRNRIVGSIVGLAIGDALGASVEFKPRGSFPLVTGYRDGSPFGFKAGQWTDDTSMALCMAESIARTGRINKEDQLKTYVQWMRHGHLSSANKTLDVGQHTRKSIENFMLTGQTTSTDRNPLHSGNGCIMRLAPAPALFWHNLTLAAIASAHSSETTHASPECIACCEMMGAMLATAFQGTDKHTLFAKATMDKVADVVQFPAHVRHLLDGSFMTETPDKLKGSGRAVECLEAALWAVWKGNGFEEQVLLAANLGNDADTTAAVAGQFAGAIAGFDAIPQRLLEGLYDLPLVKGLAEKVADAALPEDKP